MRLQGDVVYEDAIKLLFLRHWLILCAFAVVRVPTVERGIEIVEGL